MTSNDPDNKPRSLFEDQVIEILQTTNQRPPVRAKARSFWWKVKREARHLWSYAARFDNVWGWFGVAMIIFLGGGALMDDGIGHRLVQYAGLAAFGVGILRLFRPSRAGSGRKMWRGNVIDMNKRGVELGDKWDDWKKRR